MYLLGLHLHMYIKANIQSTLSDREIRYFYMELLYMHYTCIGFKEFMYMYLHIHVHLKTEITLILSLLFRVYYYIAILMTRKIRDSPIGLVL